MGFLERLKDGLSKTRRNFTDRIEELVGMSAKVDRRFGTDTGTLSFVLQHFGNIFFEERHNLLRPLDFFLFSSLVGMSAKVDEDFLEELEMILYLNR